MDAPQLRALLSALGTIYFLASCVLIWLFATGEAGSWRDPQSWPALVRIVALPLIVTGCALPVLWLQFHTSGPETSTRRFAILATIFVVAVVLALTSWAISEPTRVANWLWLAGGILFSGVVIRGIWSQVRRP